MKRDEDEDIPEPAQPGNDTRSCEIDSLQQLIKRIHCIDGDHDPVDLEAVLLQVGRRSFGTILLFAGIVVLVPLIGDIPGVPTLAAVLVAITAIQLLADRQHFWLPDFLLRRSISRARLEKTLNFVHGPARFMDRFTRRRLEFLVGKTNTRVVGAATLGVALVMPLLELIPFSANLAGIALCAFGVALIARDGLFALLSLMTMVGVFAFLGYWLTNM
jgi:hypothetical protein